MNKYQEALESLVAFVHPEQYCKEDYATLQELVDKETPNKVIKEIIDDAYDDNDINVDFQWTRVKCPCCNNDLINEYENRDFEDYPYCPECGQKLDWSDEE